VISLIVGLQIWAYSRTGFKWSGTVRFNFSYGFNLLHFNTGEYNFLYSLYSCVGTSFTLALFLSVTYSRGGTQLL
jgi:hypothetical protein